METYDTSSPLSSSNIGDLPICEAGNNGYYVSVGCAADGSFTIDQFSDQYCLQRVSTYTALSDVNSAIKNNLQSCYGIYNSAYDASVSYSTAGALIAESKSCSALDSPICTSTSRINNFGNRMSSISSASHSLASFNVANKAKYTLGILCLIGSLFMFLGILFTNRRKRRAMMHRKMRASRSRRSSSKGRSSSSRHQSSSSASRAKSRTRESSERRTRTGEDGERERSSRSKSRSSRGLTESSGRERESSGRSSSSRRVAESPSSKRAEEGVFA